MYLIFPGRSIDELIFLGKYFPREFISDILALALFEYLDACFRAGSDFTLPNWQITVARYKRDACYGYRSLRRAVVRAPLIRLQLRGCSFCSDHLSTVYTSFLYAGCAELFGEAKHVTKKTDLPVFSFRTNHVGYFISYVHGLQR